MPAPIRPQGETRRLICARLRRTSMTWREAADAVGITAGTKTRRRMLRDGEIEEVGYDEKGKALYRCCCDQKLSNHRTFVPHSFLAVACPTKTKREARSFSNCVEP